MCTDSRMKSTGSARKVVMSKKGTRKLNPKAKLRIIEVSRAEREK